MMTDPVIAAVTEEFAGFTLVDGAEEDVQTDALADYCLPAKSFYQWKEEMFAQYVRRQTDAIHLAQAKVLLVDRFFDFISCASKSHREKTSGKGHVCLYQVFLEALNEIRMVQLMTVSPPEVFVIQAKREPQAASLARTPAIFLGELTS